MKDANKRKTKRYDCLVPIESKKGTVFENSQTLDISKGGLGFVSESKIPLNKKIAVEVDLTPEGDPVLVIGAVKWVIPLPNSDSFRVGLSFGNVLSGSRTRLENYFRK